MYVSNHSSIIEFQKEWMCLSSKYQQERYPLSDMQKLILFVCLMHPKEGLYKEQVTIGLEKHSTQHIKNASMEICTRHFALRARIPWQKEKASRLVISNDVQSIRTVHCIDEADVESVMQKCWQTGVDIEQESFRITIATLSNKTNYIILDFHHIFLDGWSLAIVIEEFYHCLAGQPLNTCFDEHQAYAEYLDAYECKKTRSQPLRKNYFLPYTHKFPLEGIPAEKAQIQQIDVPYDGKNSAPIREGPPRIRHHCRLPLLCLGKNAIHSARQERNRLWRNHIRQEPWHESCG